MDKEKLIKLWMSSASASGYGKFCKDSLTLRDRTIFHNLAHISGKMIRPWWKYFYRSTFGQESPH